MLQTGNGHDRVNLLMKLSWFGLSLLALLSLALMSFLITSLTRKGYPVSFVLFVIGVGFSVFYFFQTFLLTRQNIEINFGVLGVLLIIVILSLLGNSAIFYAANAAPNPGLASAVALGAQAAVISMLAVVFLKDKLSFLQLVGIVLSVASVFLISIGSVSNSPPVTSKSSDQIISNR